MTGDKSLGEPADSYNDDSFDDWLIVRRPQLCGENSTWGRSLAPASS